MVSKIILFRGKAGVGKTLLSTQLASRIKVPIIRKDDIFDTIFDYIDDNSLRNKASYELIYNLVNTNLECGTDIIIDCPFHFNNQLLEFRHRIESRKGIFRPILVTCSNEELWKDRFNLRKINPSPNNLITDFEEMKKHYESKGINSVPLEGELVLDSSNELEQSNKYLMMP